MGKQCGNLIVLGMHSCVHAGYTGIDVTSRNINLREYFSTFYLRDIKMTDGSVAKVLENAWQYSKVYKEFTDDSENPNQTYFDWRNSGFNESIAVRHPMGHEKPLYSLYFNGIDYEKLDYIESRKKLYIQMYISAVLNKSSEVLNTLKLRLSNGENLALLDFDGYNFKSLGMGYADVVNCSSKIMGHAVLVGALLEAKVIFNSKNQMFELIN